MELILLFIVILLAWFWLDTVGKREVAIELGNNLANRMNLQLLDETVACHQLSLVRNGRGRIQVQRSYSFEVSASGSERLQCGLVLRGHVLQSWHIPPYAQPLH